jgi:hypothetical protein
MVMSEANFPFILAKSRSTYLIWPCEKSRGSRAGAEGRRVVEHGTPGDGVQPPIADLDQVARLGVVDGDRADDRVRPAPGIARAQLSQAADRHPGLQFVHEMRPGVRKLTQLQDSIVTIGGNVASNTPCRTVSLLDSTTWVRPLPLGTLTGAGPGQPCVELGVPEQVSKATSNRPAAGNCIETGAS